MWRSDKKKQPGEEKWRNDSLLTVNGQAAFIFYAEMSSAATQKFESVQAFRETRVLSCCQTLHFISD